MKSLIIFFIATFGVSSCVQAQGCVAIRSVGGLCTMDHGNNEEVTATSPKWTLNINNRYFNSFRHYVGTVEQTHRIEQGTQVINHSYTMDMALTRVLNKRWSLFMDLPIIANKRSSLYEHGGKERHETSSFGLGDMRLAAYYWMIDPAKGKKGNIQLGLGIKLPTGDYKYTDKFYTATPGTRITGPVDQSIQLGDGGTGFTTEINAYYSLSRNLSFYGNFYYLMNPREANGTSTARGGTPSANSVAITSDVMSVPDQFMVRGGLSLMSNKFTFSAGLREECIPVYDLIGGSEGFRRPGYIITAEPGITYSFKNMEIYTFVPIALTRSRTQSVPDKISTDINGKYAQGDAAFADYAVNVGLSIRF